MERRCRRSCSFAASYAKAAPCRSPTGTTGCAPATTSARTPRSRVASSICPQRPARHWNPGAQGRVMVGDEPLSSAESSGRRDGHERIEAMVHTRHGSSIAAILEREPAWARDFNDLTYEARRLFGEVFGTFLLVLAGAGAAIVEVV